MRFSNGSIFDFEIFWPKIVNFDPKKKIKITTGVKLVSGARKTWFGSITRKIDFRDFVTALFSILNCFWLNFWPLEIFLHKKYTSCFLCAQSKHPASVGCYILRQKNNSKNVDFYYFLTFLKTYIVCLDHLVAILPSIFAKTLWGHAR